ncbi:hypothetical protein CCACVL1_09138 [Corchorus capsularis]|uniref:Uncharacterized protein n=1 Tax=Corchorus capsularis TaxID=210143 RepID=A0A1R3IXL7_COCAP|nr:hypothetical protein CCACVL1_09138 [Corchorus capsularis]
MMFDERLVNKLGQLPEFEKSHCIDADVIVKESATTVLSSSSFFAVTLALSLDSLTDKDFYVN